MQESCAKLKFTCRNMSVLNEVSCHVCKQQRGSGLVITDDISHCVNIFLQQGVFQLVGIGTKSRHECISSHCTSPFLTTEEKIPLNKCFVLVYAPRCIRANKKNLPNIPPLYILMCFHELSSIFFILQKDLFVCFIVFWMIHLTVVCSVCLASNQNWTVCMKAFWLLKLRCKLLYLQNRCSAFFVLKYRWWLGFPLWTCLGRLAVWLQILIFLWSIQCARVPLGRKKVWCCVLFS